VKPFTLLYFFITVLLYVVALPWLFWLAFKPKYRVAVPARFLLRRNPPFSPGGIWFHACSVGETRALGPLFKQLEGTPLRVSTITQTGQAVAEGYRAERRYLPFELFMPWWVTSQRALVVLEAEFWYLLFAVARAKGAKVVLLNARISERSFPKYLRMRWFYRRLFAQTDKVFCQSPEDKMRLEVLGAADVEVIGNIKLAHPIEATRIYTKAEGITVVAASTHPGEEPLILKAFTRFRQQFPSSRLLVVPRHPERFDAVWELIKENIEDTETARWSLHGGYDCVASHTIILVDAMGELNNLYAVSDVAVLGGAFNPNVGGHNPLEPARFGCRTITGEHYFNQRELMRYVDHIAVTAPEGLTDVLSAFESLRPAAVNGSVDLEPFFQYLASLRNPSDEKQP